MNTDVQPYQEGAEPEFLTTELASQARLNMDAPVEETAARIEVTDYTGGAKFLTVKYMKQNGKSGDFISHG